MISFQCRSLIKSLSQQRRRYWQSKRPNAKKLKLVTLKKKGEGREKNWKDEEIEMLITLYEERPCLWDAVGHKAMNRDSKEVAYSQLDLLTPDKYDISRDDYKSKWKSVYHCTHV